MARKTTWLFDFGNYSNFCDFHFDFLWATSSIEYKKFKFNTQNHDFMERLVKRKNGASKGNAKLKPRKQKEDEQIAYLLTDVKETVVTENFYQPIPLSILKKFMPEGMMK